MKLPQQLPVPDLLRRIAELAASAHIRLALSQEGESLWIARSLVVDVFPAPWLDNPASIFTEYTPPTFLYDFQGQSLFFAGMISVQDLINWFAHPEDGILKDFDHRPGERSRIQRFRMPDMYPDAISMDFNSRQPGVYATLPWPHLDYRCTLKEPNLSRKGDFETLFAPDQALFDTFAEARSKLIRDKVGPNQSQYADQDEIEIRIVDGDGWIQKIEVSATQSKVRFAVTVGGLRISPAQVILKDTSYWTVLSSPWSGNGLSPSTKSS